MNLQSAGGVMGEEIRIGILALREGACFRPDLEHRGLRGDASIYLPQLWYDSLGVDWTMFAQLRCSLKRQNHCTLI